MERVTLTTPVPSHTLTNLLKTFPGEKSSLGRNIFFPFPSLFSSHLCLYYAFHVKLFSAPKLLDLVLINCNLLTFSSFFFYTFPLKHILVF